MRIDQQYVRMVARDLDPAAVALLRRIAAAGRLLVVPLGAEEVRPLATLEGAQMVVRSLEWFRDANGQPHEMDTVRLTPLGRDVLHVLPRQVVG